MQQQEETVLAYDLSRKRPLYFKYDEQKEQRGGNILKDSCSREIVEVK